jgi:hypothetical protein
VGKVLRKWEEIEIAAADFKKLLKDPGDYPKNILSK